MDDSYGVSDNSFQEVMKMLKPVQTLDEKGNEVDAIIELPDSTWGAFEIKLGANQIDKAAEDLLHPCNRHAWIVFILAQQTK